MCVRKLQHRVAVNEIVGVLVFRKTSSIARTEVLEQLNTRARCCPQRGNSQSCSENVVQVLLLGAVILAFSSDVHPQQVAVETQADFRVRDHNSSVVDTEEQPITPLMPLCIALALGKFQYLQWM